MQKKKKDWETLRDTGMLGAYQPEEVSLQELPSGEILSLFSDTELWEYPGQLVRKREMVIGGKVFHIASVFQGGEKTPSTPTGKLLSHIDRQLQKDPRWSMSSRWTLGSRCGILWLPYRLAREKEAAKDEGKPESEIQHPLWPAQPGG